MDRIAFVSVATTHANYGDAYLKQQDRMKKSIEKQYHDAKIFIWRNALPPGARPFLDSLYGFKPHAIAAARQQGFKKVVWLDTAMILNDKIPDYKYPVVAVKDPSRTPASNKCLQHFGITRDDLQDIDFVGGSFFYFDFSHYSAEAVLNDWLNAEISDVFGSQYEESFTGLQGHRHDETCMAIILHQLGLKPMSSDKVGYDGMVMIKQHFK